MDEDNRTKGELLQEIEELRTRLQEAEETLNAVRSGRVEASALSGEDGEEVPTRVGTDFPGRVRVQPRTERSATPGLDGEREPAEEVLTRRWQTIFDAVHDGVCLLDEEQVIRQCNRGVQAMTGKDRGEILGRHCWEVLHETSGPLPGCPIVRARETLQRETMELALEDRCFEVVVDPWVSEDGGFGGAVHLVRDITERKRMEAALRFSHRCLEITNRHTTMQPMLDEFVAEVQDFTGCAAVGIRLLDQEGHIPYESYVGFSQRFYELESPLSVQSDECMCIRVIRGDTDPTLPFFTERGSFYMNTTTRFLATVPDEQKGATRNMCNEFGYESVALVPIRLGERILGLIHVADPRENRAPVQNVDVLEALALELGAALERIQTEEALRESETKSRSLVEAIPDNIFRVGRDGTFLDPPSGEDRTLALARSEFAGKKVSELFPESLAKLAMEAARSALEASVTETLEYQMPIPLGSGNVCSFETRIVPCGHDEVLAIARDITERKRAEEAVRKSEELFRKTFASQRDAIFILDAPPPPASPAILDCNPGATDIFGYTREEMLGRTPTFLHVDEAALEEFRSHLYPAVEEKGLLSRLEFRMKRKDGTVFPTEHSVTPLEDEQGRRVGWVSVVRDTSERKRAEEALRESETRFRRVIETCLEGLWTIDAEGNTDFVNPRAAELLGYTVEEMLHESPLKFLFTRDILLGIQNLEERKQGVEERGRYRMRRKDGTELWVQMATSSLLGEDGQFLGALTVFADITDRKRAEDALRESEARYRHIFEHSPIGIGIATLDGRVVTANKAMQTIAGYTIEELQGINLADTYENVEDRKALLEAIRRHGRAIDLSVQLKRKDGTPYDALLTVSRLSLGSEDFVHTICQDITERKRAHEALRAAEEKYRDLVENVNDVIFTLDEGGVVTYVNPVMESVYGYAPSEVTGRAFVEFICGEDVPALRRSLHYALAGHVGWAEFRMVTKTGEIRWARTSGRPILSEERPVGVRGVLTDITDRKRAEEALRQSERKLRLIAENATDAIFAYDMDRRLIYVNPAVEGLTGYSVDDLKERDFINWLHPDDESAAMRLWGELFEGKGFSGVEFRIVTKDSRIKWCSSSWGPLRDENGRQIGIQGRERDITDRKQAEEALRESRNQLRALTAELALVEERERRRLARVLHDDIGQSLALAKMKLSVLSADLRPETDAALVEELRSLLEQVLEHTRTLTFELSPPVLHELGLAAALDWLCEQCQKDCRLTLSCKTERLPEPLPEALRGLLFSAARELLLNVCKHAYATTASVRVVAGETGLSLIVEDDGVGLPPTPSVSGKGFGLFNLRERLQHLGGSLRLETRAEGGARVTVEVPVEQNSVPKSLRERNRP